MTEADHSKAALLRFADHLQEGGLAKPNTARSLKVAANQILDGLSAEEESDVRKIDVELAVRRFHNKNPGKLSPSSLAEYERRVNLLIREFSKYNASPTKYTGIGRRAPTTTKRASKKESRKVARPAPTESPEPAPTAPTERSVGMRKSGLSLDFPLRTDFLAQVVVPRDMSVAEARRLCAFVMTLAADFEPTGS